MSPSTKVPGTPTRAHPGGDAIRSGRLAPLSKIGYAYRELDLASRNSL
jgi:hypothetical protein